MVVFPNCKINLGLHITAKREDGYHDIETIFYPLALKDALEVVHHTGSPGQPIQFSTTGLPVSGEPSNNLCVKAYQLLRQEYPSLPPLHLHLHKAIPMGAGLGGGSADGAFTLGLLNDYCQLNLSQTQLEAYALQLGSDCPFFIANKPCYARGRGEKMQELTLDLSGWQFLLVHPGIHVSTAWAFSKIIPALPAADIRSVINSPVEYWKDQLVNDFEAPVIAAFPEIGVIKKALYQEGAVYASLTGSGSTVFGMFRKNARLPLHIFEPYHSSVIH